MLVEFVHRQIRPDYILFADTGGEKEETLAFLPVMDAYVKKVGFPGITVVRYVPQDFKRWPPYATLEENCLTNGTRRHLPSASNPVHRNGRSHHSTPTSSASWRFRSNGVVDGAW
jgi:hypothetical protein